MNRLSSLSLSQTSGFIVICFIVHCSLLIPSCFSQQLSTRDKKAERLFFSAIDEYQERSYDRALASLKKAIDLDPSFTEAWILRGDIQADNRQHEQAIDSYQSAIRTNNPFSPGLYFILANLELTCGRYSDARSNYNRFLEFPQVADQKRQHAQKRIRDCDFALACMANPVPFEPVNAGDSVNTEFDEYINAVTPDELYLYFTRKIPRTAQTTNRSREFEEDFFRCEKPDTAWLNAVNLGPPINTRGNEGALTISPDGKYLFFAACDRPDGYGSCDLYRAERIGSRWSDPENLGPEVNSEQWDSQPAFSSDGRTLYFASKRKGGLGSSDIWKAELMPDGSWSVPVNLGDSVNSSVEEMAPFIHPDDRTLYFSSKGHPGLGGYDLFFSRKTPAGLWGRPVNLGYPINTHADEITLVVSAKGDLAYISSDIPGGKGRQDIYSFRLYKEAQPLLTTYFKGVVYDADTRQKLEARFELIDLSVPAIVARASSDPVTGGFLLVLPAEKNYALNVSKDGYLFYSGQFFLTGPNTRSEPFIKDVPLSPIRPGETVVLKNVFFDTDQYILKPESLAELERLLLLLEKNPNLKIEISGHTDNQGTADHNLELSRNRAGAVFEFLVSRGIDKDRLAYAGFGFMQPVDVNTTEQGRANNRRTEFKVLGN